MTVLESAVIAAWILIALQTLAIGGLIRQVRLVAGALPSQLSARRLQANPAALRHWTDPQRSTVLVFVSESCQACAALMPILAATVEDESLTESLRVVVLAAGSDLPDHPPALDVRPDSTEYFDAFDVRLTPFAVVLDPTGDIADHGAVGAPKEMHRLIASARSVAALMPQRLTEQPQA